MPTNIEQWVIVLLDGTNIVDMYGIYENEEEAEQDAKKLVSKELKTNSDYWDITKCCQIKDKERIF